MLGKSVKPIPVLVLGVLLARKRYSVVKYVIVLLIVVGVAVFLYKDKPQPILPDIHQFKLFDTIGIGELLVVRAMVGVMATFTYLLSSLFPSSSPSL